MRIFQLWVILALMASASEAEEFGGIRWHGLSGPCQERCAITYYGGIYVDNTMTSIFLEDFLFPTQWDYADDYIAGVAWSREIANYNDVLMLEGEAGIAQRFGEQDQTEVWGAAYVRYAGFPWNEHLYTTIAVSTGLSYASGISSKEEARGGSEGGSQLLHYLSPEITFADPEYPDTTLVFRFHHRSGAAGVVSDSIGGAHYGTVGIRFRF